MRTDPAVSANAAGDLVIESPDALLATALTAIASLGDPDPDAMAAAAARLDALTKPPGSLGRLETLAIQLAGSPASRRLASVGGPSSWRPRITA